MHAHDRSPAPRAGDRVVALGLALLAAGILLLVGWALHPLLTSPEVPWPARLGTGLVVAGLAVLLGRVIHARLAGARRDPYREVRR